MMSFKGFSIGSVVTLNLKNSPCMGVSRRPSIRRHKSRRRGQILQANKSWQGFNWFGKKKDVVEKEGATIPSQPDTEAEDAQSWEVSEPEWESETDNTKPNVLGLAIMLIIFLGSIFLTTTVFRAAGNWRQSRRQKQTPSTSVIAKKEKSNEKDQNQIEENKDRKESEKIENPQNNKEALVSSEPSQKDKEVAKDLHELKKDEKKNKAPQNPANNPNAVYTMERGWVASSDAELSGQRDPDTQYEQSYRAQYIPGSREENKEEKGNEERETEEGQNSQAQGENSEDDESASPQHEEIREEKSDDKSRQIALESTQESKAPGKTNLSEAQLRLQQAARELEERMESSGSEFWGEEESSPNLQLEDLPKLEAKNLQIPELSENELHQYSSRGFNSLRSRAGVASRASLAASEASQRAVAYSSAASQAASKAAFHAQRALTASHIAQQAAVSESERVLNEAVERAESAASQAQEAEREAAEAAAHASAHEEVSRSQSQVSQKAAEAPDLEENTGADSSQSEAKFESSKRHARKTISRAKQKIIGVLYIIKHWCQRAGHSIMEWLTVFIAWCKRVLANGQRSFHNGWLKAKGLVSRKNA